MRNPKGHEEATWSCSDQLSQLSPVLESASLRARQVSELDFRLVLEVCYEAINNLYNDLQQCKPQTWIWTPAKSDRGDESVHTHSRCPGMWAQQIQEIRTCCTVGAEAGSTESLNTQITCSLSPHPKKLKPMLHLDLVFKRNPTHIHTPPPSTFLSIPIKELISRERGCQQQK